MVSVSYTGVVLHMFSSFALYLAMNKMNQTAMWNQGYNIDSGIQTAAPSIKGGDFDDDVSSHHSFQQFEWEQNFTGEPMDAQMNEQYNNTRRFVRQFCYCIMTFTCKMTCFKKFKELP